VEDDLDDLVRLERSAEEARAKLAGLTDDECEAQRRVWRAAVEALRAAITERATSAGQDRHELEQRVKAAARRGDEDPAE
jgi:hypothetical protein